MIGAPGTAFVAVELAGEQRAQRQRVALELHYLDFEALLLAEAAVRHHEHETGVALRFQYAMPP